MDRFVTGPLSPTARSLVRRAVERRLPGTLSVGFGEHGIHRLTPRASIADVDAALANCPDAPV